MEARLPPEVQDVGRGVVRDDARSGRQVGQHIFKRLGGFADNDDLSRVGKIGECSC